jgi:hypothetical protein
VQADNYWQAKESWPTQPTTHHQQGYQKNHHIQQRQKASVQNPAQGAIRLILRHPTLAQNYAQIPDHLRQLRMADAGVLVRLLEICQQIQTQLQRAPKAAELQSECTTLEAWPMMRELAAMESLTVASDHTSQLQEAIDKLHHHYFDQRFDDLSQILRNSSGEEQINTAKKQLKSLLSEKETLQKMQKSR